MDQKVSSLTPQGSDSVRIVVRDISDAQKFLILSETDDPDNFKLPGGKLEVGEDEFSAAIRELEEELNLNLSKADLGDVVELVNDDGVSKRYIFDIQVDPIDVKPTDEISEILWVEKNSVPKGKNQGHIIAAVEAKRMLGDR